MARQLALLDSTDPDWRLDEATRTAGKRGIAAARAVLAGVRGSPAPTDDHDSRAHAA